MTPSPTDPAATPSPTNVEITPSPTDALDTQAPTSPGEAFVRGDDQGNCPEYYEPMRTTASSEQECRSAAGELNGEQRVEFETAESSADWPDGCYIIDSSLDCFKPEPNHFELFWNTGAASMDVTKEDARVMCKLSVAPTPEPMPAPTTAAPAPTKAPTPEAVVVPAPIDGRNVFLMET